MFNRKYSPVYDPSLTRVKEEEYRKMKKKENKANRHKLQHVTHRTGVDHKIYKNYSQ